MVIVPSYSYLPNNKFKKVVLPLPFLPIKPNFQLESMEKETFSNILSKLEVNDRTQATIYAYQHELV